MKLFIYIIILLFSQMNYFLYSKDIVLEFNINGMMCEYNCPDLVQSEAIKIDGIKKCEVNFKKKNAFITFDDEKINSTFIEQKLKKLTYFDIQVKNSDLNKKSNTFSLWDWLFGR